MCLTFKEDFFNLLKVTVTKTIVFFDIKLNIIMVHYLYLHQCTYEIKKKLFLFIRVIFCKILLQFGFGFFFSNDDLF